MKIYSRVNFWHLIIIIIIIFNLKEEKYIISKIISRKLIFPPPSRVFLKGQNNFPLWGNWSGPDIETEFISPHLPLLLPFPSLSHSHPDTHLSVFLLTWHLNDNALVWHGPLSLEISSLVFFSFSLSLPHSPPSFSLFIGFISFVVLFIFHKQTPVWMKIFSFVDEFKPSRNEFTWFSIESDDISI